MNNQLIKDYQSGKSLVQCSKDFDIDIKEVRKILTDNNIHIRNRQEQLVYTNESRAYAVNHLYFDELNEEKAYYLGFLAADGCVSKRNNNIHISLSSVDYDWLETFKKAIQSESPLSRRITNKGFDVTQFAFSSRMIKNKLMYYSIVPQKTYKGITMKNVPEELRWAFFKGYFDGDGSFSWSKKTKQGHFKVYSYQKGILEEFKDLVLEDYNMKITIYKLSRNQGKNIIYDLETSTVGSCIILDRFYNMIDSPCLERKRQKFNEFLDYRIENINPRAKAAFKTKVENICSSGPEVTGRISCFYQ